jgi:hypothetical protein
LGTSRGIWENDLIELTAPKANITANRSTFDEGNAIVKFADYSVADKDATYLWSFPGGTPATSTNERPEVTYSKANGDSFDVTLTVTDSRGTSSQTLTDFIKYLKVIVPTVHYVDSEETVGENGAAINAIDGSTNTFWHSKWTSGGSPMPHEIQIDLGISKNITGLTYLPRQSNSNGRIANYEIYVSNDPNNWGVAVAKGTWPNTTTLKTVNFTEKRGRYYRLVALSEVNGEQFCSAVEINVISTEIALGVDENKTGNKYSIRAYPNPFNDVLTIDFNPEYSKGIEEYINVKIINMNGQEVLTNSYKIRDNININTYKLVKGIYTLNISNASYNKTFKIVKGNVLLEQENSSKD